MYLSIYIYTHKSPPNITYIRVVYSLPHHYLYLYTPCTLQILPTHVSQRSYIGLIAQCAHILSYVYIYINIYINININIYIYTPYKHPKIRSMYFPQTGHQTLTAAQTLPMQDCCFWLSADSPPQKGCHFWLLYTLSLCKIRQSHGTVGWGGGLGWGVANNVTWHLHTSMGWGLKSSLALAHFHDAIHLHTSMMLR